MSGVKPSRIIDHDFFRRAAGRKGKRDCSQPGRPFGGRALLIKRLTLGPVYVTFENQRTIPYSTESARRDRQIVADKIEFRELRLPGKIWFLGVGHTDLAALDRQSFGCVVLHNWITLTLIIGADPFTA